MTAKDDLLRALKDRQRSEEVARAECLSIDRKRKMSTKAIARVCVEPGTALRASSPERANYRGGGCPFGENPFRRFGKWKFRSERGREAYRVGLRAQANFSAPTF